MSTEWETPQDLFDTLNQEFMFTVDACASDVNAKLPRYWTKDDNGLTKDWAGEVVWLNPPYDKDIWRWIEKAYEESLRGATVVALLQGRFTDNKMWHDWVMRSSEIRFIKDRLHFKLSGQSGRAAMGHVVVVFRPYIRGGHPRVKSIDTKGNDIH